MAENNIKSEFTEAQQQAAETAPYIIVAENKDGNRDIQIKNMMVKTPGENGTVLVKNANMTIKSGSRVIMTGVSGSGKTTVAKAILNQWDYGTGLIVMPQGVKIMAMSQQAYFPNTTIRSILNLAPPDQCRFEDKELTRVLKTVGHDKLVQHIPGQQIEIMFGDLLAEMPQYLRGAGDTLDEHTSQNIRDALAPLLTKLIQAQFTTVQYVPEQQRNLLREKIAPTLEAARIKADDAALDDLTDGIVKDIDLELAKPLVSHLSKFVPAIAAQQRGRIYAYTPEKAAYFGWSLNRKLRRKVTDYMANKDTDDQQREIRINKTQADHVVETISAEMDQAFANHTQHTALHYAFNTVSWPLSIGALAAKANASARDLTQRLTFFMDKQVLRGESLTLSGGERQKLVIAMALLHKPDILILDEITAALDRATGEKLYSEMLGKIPPETTVLSIAHNEHIMKYHTHHARLENQGITLTEIDKNKAAPTTCPTCPHKP